MYLYWFQNIPSIRKERQMLLYLHILSIVIFSIIYYIIGNRNDKIKGKFNFKTYLFFSTSVQIMVGHEYFNAGEFTLELKQLFENLIIFQILISFLILNFKY